MLNLRITQTAIALALALAAFSMPAQAQGDAAASYPNKPIRFIVGFGAGGGTDLLARIVGAKLSDIAGQPVVIENRTGAGGQIAVEYVQNQPKDGYTILIGAIGQLAVSTAIYPNLPFHPTRTLMPITMLGSYPLALVAQQNDRIKTVKDLIAYGKAHPDKTNYPTSSPAFTIASELFKLKTGMPGTAIPYRSTNEMVLSIVSGQTVFGFPDSSNAVAQAKSGKLRTLAVANPTRIPELPDVPTLAEAGYGGVDIKTQWIGAFLAAGTPEPIARKIEAALRKADTDPAVRERIRAMTYFAEGGPADEFRARIDADIKLFSDVVKEAKLKFER
jgi:tripartite-type tricarboxylate transporter receptor subunit TctC